MFNVGGKGPYAFKSILPLMGLPINPPSDVKLVSKPSVSNLQIRQRQDGFTCIPLNELINRVAIPSKRNERINTLKSRNQEIDTRN